MPHLPRADRRAGPDAACDVDDRQLAGVGHRPARAAGLGAVFIPNAYTWALEHDELDPDDAGHPAPGRGSRSCRRTSDRATASTPLPATGWMIVQTDPVADIDWAERANTAEQAIMRRHLRRIGGRAARHPDRADPLAAAHPDRPVPVALLVAGAPAGLPGRRAAQGSAAGARPGDRGDDPQRPAAQRRQLDQPLLRRHRLVRAGGAAGRRRSPGARARRRSTRSARSWAAAGPRTAAAGSGGAAATPRRTPRPTARPRSCWPARGRSGSPRPSSTG